MNRAIWILAGTLSLVAAAFTIEAGLNESTTLKLITSTITGLGKPTLEMMLVTVIAAAMVCISCIWFRHVKRELKTATENTLDLENENKELYSELRREKEKVASLILDMETLSKDYESTLGKLKENLSQEETRTSRLERAFHIAHRIIHEGRNSTNDLLVSMDQGNEISKKDIHNAWDAAVRNTVSHIAELFSDLKGAPCHATLKIIGQRNSVLFTYRDRVSLRKRKNSLKNERQLSTPMRKLLRQQDFRRRVEITNDISKSCPDWVSSLGKDHAQHYEHKITVPIQSQLRQRINGSAIAHPAKTEVVLIGFLAIDSKEVRFCGERDFNILATLADYLFEHFFKFYLLERTRHGDPEDFLGLVARRWKIETDVEESFSSK